MFLDTNIFTPDSNLLQPTCEAKGRNTAGNTQTCTSCNVIGYKNGKQCQLKRALWLALAWMFTYGDPIIIDVLECILAAVYYLSGWLYWDGWEKGQLTQVTLLPPKWDQRTRRPKSGPHEDKYRLWLDKSNKNRTCPQRVLKLHERLKKPRHTADFVIIYFPVWFICNTFLFVEWAGADMISFT